MMLDKCECNMNAPYVNVHIFRNTKWFNVQLVLIELWITKRSASFPTPSRFSVTLYPPLFDSDVKTIEREMYGFDGIQLTNYKSQLSMVKSFHRE